MAALRLLPLLVLLLLALPPVPLAGAESSAPVRVTALAVEETAQGYVGTAATVEAVAIAGGTGRVYVSTKPLAQTDMQGSARLAAQVAAATLGVDWTEQDYLVSFTGQSTVIGGPSAGSDMALALTTALHNLLHPSDVWRLDPSVAATGTINPDGTIGPVGGVPAKAEGAAKAGIKTFLYPAGLDVAPTVKPGRLGLQQVQVDMAQHCRDLGITCRSVSTLAEVVAAADHVDLQPPAIPVPSTTDYAGLLGPGVRDAVDHLAARLDRASRVSLARLTATQQGQVNAELANGHTQLDAAHNDLAASRFYAAATDTFQGALATGRAENLTSFYLAGRSERVVLDALAGCDDAVMQAQAATANLTVEGLNAMFAVGAAQARVADAERLRAQARSADENAAGFSDWVASMHASVFCRERAKTALWWAELRHTFVPGPVVPDLALLAQDAIDQADDLVSYADAVMLAAAQAAPHEADAALQDARTQLKAGRPAAAILAAVDAQTYASVAMQTGGGADVPDAVLDAARQGAARAIDRARSQGVEPMLSVSLVELAQGRSGSTALQEYWSARSLALLQTEPAGPSVASPTVDGGGGTDAFGSGGVGGGYQDSLLLVFLAMGFLVGLGGAGIVVVALMAKR